MNFIVAADNNYAIGKNGTLIYNLPSDLKYFKEQTLNKVVVMGSKTYLSLPKHPLPKRTNIVMTRSNNTFEGAITVHSTDELGKVLKQFNTDDVFVIGGANIYNLLMAFCKKAFITRIYATKAADTFINNIEQMPNWKLVSKSPVQEENGLKFSFCIFENNNVEKL
ncbi:MAG: dihydrofolate reductase [Clostridia bacterium]|nr:dihydrofolate reductase [Clostridia bacterium]